MSVLRQDVSFRSLGENLAASIFYPQEQPAPAVLICHGAGEFKENYFELAEFLAARGVAAVPMDMHGHGGSGGERFHVNMREWIADIRAAIDFLTADPRIDGHRLGAFGLSSGGTAILETALIDKRLKALVALDATVRSSMPLSFSACMRLLVLLGRVKKQFTQLDLRVPLAKMMGGIHLVSDPQVDRRLRSDPRLLEAYMAFPFPGAADSIFVDTIRRVGGVAAPTLVLWGEEDKLDPPETARLLYEALACPKRLHIIPGNGHMGHLDRNKHEVFASTTDWVLEHLKTNGAS
ncbi:MAG: alpha/beta fold hydrolase [Verrucomicrobiota bacterium]